MTRRVQAFEVDCSMSAGEELNFVSSRALASVTNSQQSMGRYSDEFCGRIAKVERYDTVMVVQAFKICSFHSLKHPFNAKTMAAIFAKEAMRLHGYPRSICRIETKYSKAQFGKSYSNHWELNYIGLETYLHCFAMGTPKQSSRWILWVKFNYNTSFHRSSRLTPFEVLDGQLRERDAMLVKLKSSLNVAQQRMIKAANSKRREVEFVVGDQVYLKLRPYRQSSLMSHTHPKLAPRYIGPF